MAYTAYKSDLYTVTVDGVTCTIVNTTSGWERFFQGDDASSVTAVIDVIPARVPDDKVVAATDHYLSQYFG
jgi:hypothetical protein